MSDFSLTLVLRLTTSKIINDVAKVQMKSEKITPFGGIFHVRELFSRFVAPIIDKVLGIRCTSFGYQYICKQSGIAERISVPAKWIRTARRYELNIYTDNKSYLNPFALADG